jgi:carboxyl-terminal processing protease
VKPAVLLALVAVGSGALGFLWRDLQQGRAPDSRALGRLVGVKTTGDLSPDAVFKAAFRQIESSYYRPVNAQDLKYAGMQGLLSALGDPHTAFLPPRAARAFTEETRANFSGVGARLQPDPLGARAVSVFEDGPAYGAGLRATDLITGVDGKNIGGLAIDAIVDRIKGPEGTTVRLSILRKGETAARELTIRRARIVTPTVESQLLDNRQIGYMNISQFSEPTVAQFDRALQRLEQAPIKGLVIDLRDNPGGLLDSAAELLSRFVENKTVVTMKGRDASETVRTFSGATREFTYPIAVLINEDSASAAEIFAGCLRDYGKATLVGEHTYGKSSVQTVFMLADRSSAKVTIAKYFLPNGEDIGRQVDGDGAYVTGGLQPDVKVELNWEKEPRFGDPASDNQLAKAIEILLAKQ